MNANRKIGIANSTFLFIFLKIFFIVFLFTDALADASDKALKEAINSQVTQLVSLLQDPGAQEYRPARGIKILREGTGHASIAAVVFTIEGFGKGNNYFQYLAVFDSIDEESDRPPPRFSLLDFMMVGGKGIRGVEFDQIKIERVKNGLLITIPTLEYGPSDAFCCPTIKSKAQFILSEKLMEGHRLEEIKKRIKK